MADFEKITVSSTAVGLSPANYTGQGGCVVTVESAQIRVRLDGSNPDASNGHLLDIGDSIEITGAQDMSRFKAIRTSSTDATLFVSYRGV